MALKYYQKLLFQGLILIGLISYSSFLISQETNLSYYLNETEFDKNIPTPESYLGFQIGEWHITHAQLVGYLSLLADKSDRLQLKEYARSHEHKPLIHLVISSPKNLSKIDEIKKDHLNLTIAHKSNAVDTKTLPGIVYQGYSIHGNESSGSNAAALVAYYLAAGQGEIVKNTLDKLVILLDPSMNPDGFQRFSTWVNSNRHYNLTGDPVGREFNEPWPGGRTNHYWFDLNRDWLLLAHPESRGRIAVFHDWNPMILTDHHEMGSHSSFFFQPGVPSRTNPLTPEINQKITEDISKYHASALDSIGSEYFTKKKFDDFYYGKGSTYPDVHGCIGILFEQASSRGHMQLTKTRKLSFPFTIRNQVVTSLSTQKAAVVLREYILDYKRDYFKLTSEEGLAQSKMVYQVWDKDRVKVNHMLDILNRHQISTYKYSHSKNEYGFQIPIAQKQHRLIKSLFDPVTEFNDSIFYDVSTWHFPSAFNVNYHKSSVDDITQLTQIEKHIRVSKLDMKAKSYFFNWDQYNAPAFLNALLLEGIEMYRGRVSPKNAKIEFPDKNNSRDVIIIYEQKMDKNKLFNLSDKWEVEIEPIDKGEFLLNQLDTMSLKPVKIAMIVGEKISAYDAGHTWHQSDFRWNLKPTIIDKTQLPNTNLEKYDLIILPHGKYDDPNTKAATNKLENYVNKGGNLLVLKNAIDFVVEEGWINLVSRETKFDSINKTPAQVIGGAIYMTKINQENPLSFGYKQNFLALFKKGKVFYDQPENKNAVSLYYSSTPRYSGYATEAHLAQAKKALALASFKKGEGKIICMVDNPNFRGYWFGANKLFANTVFFNQCLSDTFLQIAPETKN